MPPSPSETRTATARQAVPARAGPTPGDTAAADPGPVRRSARTASGLIHLESDPDLPGLLGYLVIHHPRNLHILEFDGVRRIDGCSITHGRLMGVCGGADDQETARKSPIAYTFHAVLLVRYSRREGLAAPSAKPALLDWAASLERPRCKPASPSGARNMRYSTEQRPACHESSSRGCSPGTAIGSGRHPTARNGNSACGKSLSGG